MWDLDAAIKKLYAKQPLGRYQSERQFRHDIKKLAADLFSRQPTGTGLSERAFQIFLVTAQELYDLALSEIERRLRLPKQSKLHYPQS